MGGVPHPRSGWGVPGVPLSSQVWMVGGTQGNPPTPGLDGVPHPHPHWTEQHSEHLLLGGRYASCVHAGGLSGFETGLVLQNFLCSFFWSGLIAIKKYQ